MSNTTETSTSNPTTTSTLTMLNGQVKWFNNRRTYGWITVVSDGDYNGKDIFVHQSNIQSSGYRTLTTGEYVSFELSPSTGEKHPYHAINVTGINGGLLLCDINSQERTRDFRNRRSQRRQDYTRSDRSDDRYDNRTNRQEDRTDDRTDDRTE